MGGTPSTQRAQGIGKTTETRVTFPSFGDREKRRRGEYRARLGVDVNQVEGIVPGLGEAGAPPLDTTKNSKGESLRPLRRVYRRGVYFVSIVLNNLRKSAAILAISPRHDVMAGLS